MAAAVPRSPGLDARARRRRCCGVRSSLVPDHTAGADLRETALLTGPATPPANSLDADTAGLEASAGQWQPWFSTTLTSSAEQARSGDRSLRVEVTQPYGWGVIQSNWPGFVATPGPKTIRFWGLAPAAADLSATMTVHWRTAAGEDLGTEALDLPLGSPGCDLGGGPGRRHGSAGHRPGGGGADQPLGPSGRLGLLRRHRRPRPLTAGAPGS